MTKRLAYKTLYGIIPLFLIGWIFSSCSQLWFDYPLNKLSIFNDSMTSTIIYVVSVMVALAIYKKVESSEKNMLRWLVIANIGLFINDFIFSLSLYFPRNFILNLSIVNFTIIFASYLTWPFAIIIFLTKTILKHVLPAKQFIKIMFFFILINIAVGILFLSSVHYAFGFWSWQTITQVISFAIEFIIFDLLILCLIYTENRGMISFLSGFTVLVSGDFFINYSFVTQTSSLFAYGQFLWVLGLFFICIGLCVINKDKDYAVKNWFRKHAAIKSRLAFWTFSVANVSFIIFAILAYIFFIVNRETFVFLPLFTMGYSIFVVILAVLMGRNFEQPFKQLSHNIETLMLGANQKIDASFSIVEFSFLQQFIVDLIKIKEDRDRTKKQLGEITAQVAHDIRSPLTTLNMVMSDMLSIPENKRIMIKSACKRINDIANNLLYQSQDNDISNHIASVDNTTSPELIYFILENIVTEKNYEYQGRSFKIILDGYEETASCFSNINLTVFKRILSNIINNSVEALNPDGYVCIQLSCDEGFVDITIQDNGCGIPPAVLPNITEDGFSYGKETGTGCGLFHAKQHIEQMHGSLVISSDVDVGTTVRIRLLRTDFPDWFCDSILVTQNAHIVILDDDPSIHDAWNEKFSAFTNMTLSHFMTSADLMAQPSLEAELYLMDYELLAGDKNGLDVIEHLDLNRCSFLVTSCFEDSVVRKRCEIMGVKILPKPYVSSVPIILSSHAKQKPVLARYDLIFVDDSKNLTDAWELVALKAGKHILTFNNLESFEKVIQYIDLKTPIYIDSDLGCKIKGEQYAESLFHRGFKDLYLSTGHMPEYFGDLPWIRAIVGKEPPVDFI